ncbi:MAG: hypothetical protein A4E28_00255 [Methanocella sp. PtaU1.Bin125]|nr:MAG: hypothetical protein A4E28_00255 [Methanocella sp. PtaU1.Bin125]
MIRQNQRPSLIVTACSSTRMPSKNANAANSSRKSASERPGQNSSATPKPIATSPRKSTSHQATFQDGNPISE